LIKVIDIFAGPGGLSEGFSSVDDGRKGSCFDIVLSIEKDVVACETLTLRAFFRQFKNRVPDEYYSHLRGEIDRETLYDLYPDESKAAIDRCWRAELGPGGESENKVRKRISKAIGNEKNWVLIGGPPCQAYSLAGRSRNLGNPDYDPKKDVRQRLYVEYLQILAEYRPAVFIMENVKGLLSATIENEGIFHRILEDLRNPAKAIIREGRGSHHVREGGYNVHSLIKDHVFLDGDLDGLVIKAEEYGIPQARHRVILLGIRDDIKVKPRILKKRKKVVPLRSVLAGLPKLRSGISPRKEDSSDKWVKFLQSKIVSRWANAGAVKADGRELSMYIKKCLRRIVLPKANLGGEFMKRSAPSLYQTKWYCDERIGGVCNHSSRSHMKDDLCRYFYAASYAKRHGKSPRLRNFPKDLLPEHKSVDDAIETGCLFSDRFRVQLNARPSTTVVSHISKDGHYYIHPDPLQCRSLTVREAARLQTFPDNYLFCGDRTSQYLQVGNAVPPLLARQIGGIVRDLLVAVRKLS